MDEVKVDHVGELAEVLGPVLQRKDTDKIKDIIHQLRQDPSKLVLRTERVNELPFEVARFSTSITTSWRPRPSSAPTTRSAPERAQSSLGTNSRAKRSSCTSWPSCCRR